jgi:hypothetical protein
LFSGASGAITIVLEEMTALTPAHRRLITGRKRAYLDFIRQTLRQLAAEGKLRNVNPVLKESKSPKRAQRPAQA